MTTAEDQARKTLGPWMQLSGADRLLIDVTEAICAAEQDAVAGEKKRCAEIARHWIEAADQDAPGGNHDMRKTAGCILAAIENPTPENG